MDYIEELHDQWRKDPSSVGESWQSFFTGFELASCPRSCVASQSARDQSNVASLIFAYRSEGHRQAKIDPLKPPTPHPGLALDSFNLSDADLDRVFDTGHLGGPARATLREIIAVLEETYCGAIGVEYVHIQDVPLRRWIQARIEPRRNQPNFDRERKRETLRHLIDAELFESFLQSRYLGQKRFSLEGAESLVPGVHALVELAPELGVEEIIIGMAHRGRLNVLANILDKSYEMLFSEFEDIADRYMAGADGDVKYHKGFNHDHVNSAGKSVHVSLAANPSHLEAVDPVVEGRVRAQQRRRDDIDTRTKVVPLLIHGDAAFSGQGLVAETLNLSQLSGYRTGGTVHIIVNNQIGFTTSPEEARSTPYATDIAKAIAAPVFHVNGDDPEAVIYAVELALLLRQEFGRDVVVDINCYRRHGHNEADEPAFTQPLLYAAIKQHEPVRKRYTRKLIGEGLLPPADEAAIDEQIRAELERAFAAVKAAEDAPPVSDDATAEGCRSLEPYSHAPVTTAVAHDTLVDVAGALTTIPPGFALNRKIARHLPQQLAAVRDGGDINWALAEALAFGTLVRDGNGVRLSGQDSARGTFSHRHAVWYDTKTAAPHTPLLHVHADQARFCVHNSLLSEAAVLGFEYGYSLDEPDMLILWEAQFGDFANGAQVIIDQFIVSSCSKWGRACGLVMLLPHGYEGQGPEHSNAYLERYLAACAQDNIQVCNLTTPAQFFHALRRQLKRQFRKPLVIMTPKSLLRHARVTSPIAELAEGHFREILDDPSPPAVVEHLVLCSGKVYYDLLAGREVGPADSLEPRSAPAAALIRIEQFYPLNRDLLREIVGKYPAARRIVWVQEESQNRGGWSFMFPHLHQMFPDHNIEYVGRRASASPATGSAKVHREGQERIVREALALAPHND